MNETFYCKFDIYAVDDKCKPDDTRHVMSATASTEADWLMWDNAVKMTEHLYIPTEYAELSDWACELHRKRDIDNGVQQYQYCEGL